MDLSYTPRDRAEFYRQAFPDFPPLRADDRWLDGIWILGNDYRSQSRLYGAYPPNYLKRVLSLFPDRQRTLHAFSGSVARPSLSASHEVTLDLQQLPDKGVEPHVQASVLAPPFLPGSFDLVLADPPYGPVEAARYGVPYAQPRKVLRALHGVVAPGGHLVWLDTSLPMFARPLWHWWGVIGIVRSTNHKFRMVSIFQRV